VRPTTGLTAPDSIMVFKYSTSASRDRLDGDAYPHLVEHIAYHADPGVVGEGSFEFGLDLILDRLSRLRVAG
jgi:hypothetical protein